MAARKLDLAKHQLWRERLTAWKTGGLSLPEFCRLNNLNLHTVRFWQKNILKSDAPPNPERPGTTISRKRATKKKPKKVKFEQVNFAEASEAKVCDKKTTAQNYRTINVEISTPKGYLIRMASDADPASIAMVLNAAEQV